MKICIYTKTQYIGQIESIVIKEIKEIFEELIKKHNIIFKVKEKKEKTQEIENKCEYIFEYRLNAFTINYKDDLYNEIVELLFKIKKDK